VLNHSCTHVSIRAAALKDFESVTGGRTFASAEKFTLYGAVASTFDAGGGPCALGLPDRASGSAIVNVAP